MKLTKNTRENITGGTILFDGKERLLVTTVIELPRGKNITVEYMDGKNAHRRIYAMPLSSYYGLEIMGNIFEK